MRISHLLLVLLLAVVNGACGDDGGSVTVDAPNIDAPPAVDAPQGQLSCASYCTSIQANCTGANQQFTTPAQCMASCGHFPVGMASDMANNTLGCRTYHAGVAMAAPTVHCRHAGPGGDATCGADCEGFCAIVLGSCTGGNAQYGGMLANCMNACAGFNAAPPYSAAVTSGNSRSCRLYHATAASAAPVPHCNHTAAVSSTCN